MARAANVPRAGQIAVFDRSHYEDVLIVRVQELVPEERWRRRYDHINAFEQMLVDAARREEAPGLLPAASCTSLRTRRPWFAYSMRRPLMARLITSCWICSVPSKMSMILASRWKRSTGYSRT